MEPMSETTETTELSRATRLWDWVCGRPGAIYVWLKTPPENPAPRGVTLLMWALIVGGGAAASYGIWNIVRMQDRIDCERRVDGREDLRGAFGDLYDYVSEGDSSPETEASINQLRARLDRRFDPRYDVEACLAELEDAREG